MCAVKIVWGLGGRGDETENVDHGFRAEGRAMMLEGCLNSEGYLVYRTHVSINREGWRAEVFEGSNAT